MNLESSAPCHFSSPSWFYLVLESQRSARAEDVYILDNFPHLKTLIREKALGCVLFHFWIRISDRHSNWLIAKVLHSKGNSTACRPFNEVHNMCLTFFIIHELNQHFWHGYARQTFSKMLARYCFTIPTSSSHRFPLSFFSPKVPRFESSWLHKVLSWERRVKCQVNCLCDSADFDVTGGRVQSPLWRTQWWHRNEVWWSDESETVRENCILLKRMETDWDSKNWD